MTSFVDFLIVKVIWREYFVCRRTDWAVVRW